MTIMAGILGRGSSVSLPDAACDALIRSLSRHPADRPVVHRDARCLLAKVDVGAYGESAFRGDADGSISMLAGEPLLVDAGERVRGRNEDLDRLHEAWSRGEDDLLSGASGTYCAVHYQPASGRIRLIADKIGLRPLYFWVGDDFLVFATALRILEQVPIVPKRMDLRGVTELATLGIPLSDRTPYVDVSMLKAAEIVDVSDSHVSRSRYWRWDSIPESKSSAEELCRSAYERFNAAIERRLRGDTATTAFLSGGLDSRCIVTELRRRKVEVRSFNFAPPASQDQVLGREFARRVGVHHREVPMKHEGGNAKFAITLAAALNDSASDDEVSPERPRLAWSGDGGSIGVGHVRVTPRVVELLRSGDRDAAIDTFLREQKASVPSRLFRTGVADQLEHLLEQGIAEELEELHCEDPARSFHLFLMLNDQRRHLADHFEHIDLHRVEYQLPFYDADFLELILSIPMDLCIRHGFYVQWIREFPEVFMSAPWQAYPGSVPCPLPVPDGLSYQWSKDARSLGLGRRRTGRRVRKASEILAADDFPSPIMRKGMLRLALWIHRRGIRDYGYLLRSAERYYTYWKRCDGRYLLPSGGDAGSA